MLAKKGAERTGKIISMFGLTAQIDENGAAVALNRDENLLLTQEGLNAILGEKIELKCIDHKGLTRVTGPEVIRRTGLRGKRFEFTERVRHISDHVRTSFGAHVILDQYGHPYHPEAIKEKQYYSLEGDIVTLDADNRVKRKLDINIRMPIFIQKGDLCLNLNYQLDRYALADIEGKCFLFDQSAIIIDAERVMKYDRLVRGVINKFFPLKQCIEGSYFYDDLVNRGRELVVKSLIQIDYDKAINTVSSNNERKKVTDAERLKYKQENPEEAFSKCEENWVQQALFGGYRRLAHKHSEKKLEGKTVSMNAAIRRNAKQVDEYGAEVNLFDMLNDCEEGVFADDKNLGLQSIENEFGFDFDELLGSDDGEDTLMVDVNQANKDIDFLYELIDSTEGKPDQDYLIRKAILELPESRQEDIKALLKNNIASNILAAKSDEEMAEDAETAKISNDIKRELDKKADDETDEE